MQLGWLAEPVRRALQCVDLCAGTDFSVRLNHYWRGLHRKNLELRPGQLAFVHIPKTGGTTLWEVLKAALPADILVDGGLHMPVSRRCLPGAFRYVTILRDPAERVWSHYQMVLRHGPPDPYIIYAGRGLGAYLKHSWEASNMVTGYLAGRPRSTADESLLEEAATNLDNFLFVLGFADLEAEINRMLEALGVKRHRISIPHRRRAKKAIWTDS